MSALQIGLIMISIVWSKRIFVNSNAASNDSILYSGAIVNFLRLFVNVLPFLIVYCDLCNGFRNWARYLAKLWVAVPVLEMIGLSGSFSTVPLFGTLFSLAVP